MLPHVVPFKGGTTLSPMSISSSRFCSSVWSVATDCGWRPRASLTIRNPTTIARQHSDAMSAVRSFNWRF